MKSLILSLGLVSSILAAGTAHAQSAATSSVMPADAMGCVVLCPDLPSAIPASKQLITVRDAAGAPMANVPVTVSLPGSFTICSSAVLSGVTNNAGQVTIVVAGGGCDLNPGAVKITANGIGLRGFPGRSPDFDGAGGNQIVDIADLIAFSNDFLAGFGTGCFDFNSDQQVGLQDLIIFGPAFVSTNNCP